jgi:sodium pump decarboxylase gamma subunit
MEINFAVEGLKFMFLGMTTVFTFLFLLVFILKIQEKIFKKFFPQKERKTSPVVPAVSSSKQDDSQVIAAITAAITEFKK